MTEIVTAIRFFDLLKCPEYGVRLMSESRLHPHEVPCFRLVPDETLLIRIPLRVEIESHHDVIDRHPLLAQLIEQLGILIHASCCIGTFRRTLTGATLTHREQVLIPTSCQVVETLSFDLLTHLRR